jgi:SAM-dependent methyltransferase
LRTGDSYDRLAEEYTARLADELMHKPLDRALLASLAERVRGLAREDKPGLICDLGCRPGHVARYLHELGASVLGVDLSEGMLARARHLNPELEFRRGDMRALEVPDGAWGGIAAFYSIIHIPRDAVVGVLRELRRVLCPGGWLLVAFHVGEDVLHRDELWGVPVDLDFTFFRRVEMERYLLAAGFGVNDSVERSPYRGVEYPSQPAYIFARNVARANLLPSPTLLERGGG